MSTAAITISNVLRVQSRPRVPSVCERKGISRRWVFIAVNLVSLSLSLFPCVLHRTRNPPAIDIAIASTTLFYLREQVHWRGERCVHVRIRACPPLHMRGRACNELFSNSLYRRYYLSRRANYTGGSIAKYFTTSRCTIARMHYSFDRRVRPSFRKNKTKKHFPSRK